MENIDQKVFGSLHKVNNNPRTGLSVIMRLLKIGKHVGVYRGSFASFLNVHDLLCLWRGAKGVFLDLE